MGYLISAHIIRDKPNVERLFELPASIGRRVYHHRSSNVYIIDTFRASRSASYPFQSPLPAADISLELPTDLVALRAIEKFLNKRRLANSFKASYINFGLTLNRLLGMPVLSLISDDDEWDFASTVADGALSRLRCRCGDLNITYDDGTTRIEPLALETDDDEFLTNLDELRDALPGIFVADRTIPFNSQLHAIASDEWRLFGNTDTMILGLGSFNPPEDEPDWQLIERSSD